jgi:hypothetical protein
LSKCFGLICLLSFVAACGGAQMSDMDPQPAPVRGFDSHTTAATRGRLQVNERVSTSSLRGESILEKAPARLSTPSKSPLPGNAPKTGVPLETRVLETGIEAKEFLQVIGPTLGKNLTAKQVDSAHVAVTGTSESLRRTVQVADQIRAAMKRPPKALQLRVALLSDQTTDDSTTAIAISRAEVADHLKGMNLEPGDMEAAALPDELYKLTELTAPATGGGENRVQLTDRFTLLYELRQTLAGDYEVALNLAEKDKGMNPFDTSVGRIIFANHFRSNTTRPVVLGITTPTRTIMLVMRLQNL